ncbi:efflux RND transporter periplasmic adaptor subunit [Cohaesibacter celericrescens]|uniref:Efflux RND transporter periplasmic adaptor subunit n=1 Tax=Cohaesibacter celericrescens TaxID=2067669 RepID=A0A2N5XMV6_9HYPH|nr:efflux RND transporter periplasmic adaptor subunit [Cohaesibacter celericrescens]PLW75770.1 efflux RND transporter periplasmic adaptor subunit [Cohaesibacter celericrescens]
MKHLYSILIASILIAAAYLYQYGLPTFESASLQVQGEQVPSSQPANGQAATEPSSPAPGAQLPAKDDGRPRPEPRIVSVTVAEVDFKPYEVTYSAIGTAEALQSVSVVSEVSGQIEKIHFDGTQSVSKGDVLIELESVTEQLNVEIAKANFTKAEESLKRYQLLRERNSGVVTDVTMTEQEATTSVARSNLALAEANLTERTILAPISGKLGLSDLQQGDYLADETAIVTINNTETILVTFSLPEKAIDILSIGKEIETSTPAKPGMVFKGKVTAFDSQIDESTRTVTVRAAIDNKDRLLWPGMTFSVSLFEESDPMAVIPSMALAWTREGTQVWLAEGDTVRPVPVTFRHRRDDTIWIEGDLQQGTQVVVDGVHKLRPGFQIAVVDGDSSSISSSAHSSQKSNQEAAQ